MQNPYDSLCCLATASDNSVLPRILGLGDERKERLGYPPSHATYHLRG
jgi:hypothetical protein